jgi:hypothetical protein
MMDWKVSESPIVSYILRHTNAVALSFFPTWHRQCRLHFGGILSFTAALDMHRSQRSGVFRMFVLDSMVFVVGVAAVVAPLWLLVF